MKSRMLYVFLALAVVGCSSRPLSPSSVEVRLLREKIGVSPAEWSEMMKPLAEAQGADCFPTRVEFLRPGVIVVYLAYTFDVRSRDAGELRFLQQNGKWIQQIGVLSENHRKRGRFISIAEFERLLIENETEIRRNLADGGKDSVVEFSFDHYVPGYIKPDPKNAGRRSRLPSIQGWRHLISQIHYDDEVFVISSARETVVALRFEGEFRYLIYSAFDFTNIYIPPGMSK